MVAQTFVNNDKMNKNKTTKNIAISVLSVLILVYSTVLQFSMPSVVLCFGDDGHIAFEQSDENNQCVDVDDNITLPVNNSTDLSDQKEDCQDVPLINVLSALYLEKNSKIKTVKPAVFDVTVDTIKAHLVSKIGIRNSYNIIHTSKKSLQTTILLI